MPRRRRPARGKLGKRLEAAIEDCGLTPQEVAAAARINKGTLYRLLSGETSNPHHSTIRQLCKVLQLDIADVIGAEQLELIDDRLKESGVLSELEELLLLELQSFEPKDQRRASEVAVFALRGVELGMGRGTRDDHLPRLDHIRATSRLADAVIEQLRVIPPHARPAAARAALGALFDLKLGDGGRPSSELTRPLHNVRRKWVGIERPKRLRPKQRKQPTSNS